MNVEDVVIVGGGPAGSGFALACARAGRKVVILEKNPVPSAKVCGGVLSPRCLRAIERIGFGAALRSVPANSLDHLDVELASGASLRIPFPSDIPSALVVDRCVLDAAFWHAAGGAGAELHEQTVATRVQPVDKGGWRVEARGGGGGGGDGETGRRGDAGTIKQRNSSEKIFTASMLAAADGRNSFVARQLGLVARGGGRSLCYQYRLRRHEFARSGVHFFLFPGGYCGLSVDGTGLAHLDVISLCGGESEEALRARLMRQRSQFVERLERAAFCEDRVVTRSPIGSGWRPKVERRDVVLLGDAQLWVEPFTGEGIGLALESARVAVAAWMGGGEAGERPRGTVTNRWVARAIERPWLARAMVGLLRMAPGVGRWMAREVLGAAS